MTVALEVRELTFSYRPGVKIIDRVSFSLEPGEVLGLMGLSGCGKSTLCLALCGIIPHSQEGLMEGDVFLYGENTRNLTLPQIATLAGIVFQDPETQLFLPRIINELAFGPENLCLPREEIRQAVQHTAKLAGIEDLLPCNPNELSGGQQQLAALAAVLCLNPPILVLDEVASQLDRDSCRRVLELIGRLKENGKTIVMVDHHAERLQVADKIMVMEAGKLLPAEGVPR